MIPQDTTDFVEEVTTSQLILKPLFLPGEGEGLAREACTQNLMRRNILCLDFRDVAKDGDIGEDDFV